MAAIYGTATLAYAPIRSRLIIGWHTAYKKTAGTRYTQVSASREIAGRMKKVALE